MSILTFVDYSHSFQLCNGIHIYFNIDCPEIKKRNKTGPIGSTYNWLTKYVNLVNDYYYLLNIGFMNLSMIEYNRIGL